MQEERDDQDAGQDEEVVKPDPFDSLDDIEGETAFRAWDLQVHAIDTIGDVYAKLAQVDNHDTSDILRAIGHSLIDLVEDHRPRKAAILASVCAANRLVETDE